MLRCDAFRALQEAGTARRNRVSPCFLQKEVSTSKLPVAEVATTQRKEPGGPSAEADLPGELFVHRLQTLAQDGSPRSPVVGTLFLKFLEGLGVGEPHPCLPQTF